MSALKRPATMREPPVMPEDRSELSLIIWSQRERDKSGIYKLSEISRGVEKAHLGRGMGYNKCHGIDFYAEFRRALDEFGRVRLLDVGCALGYFLKDMLDYAEAIGAQDRLEARGVTLTRQLRATDIDAGVVKSIEQVLGPDIVRVAHAEKLPFPDNHFEMVVTTLGPNTYYDGFKDNVAARARMLNELYRVTAPRGRIYLHGVFDGPQDRDGSTLNVFLKANTGAKVTTPSTHPTSVQILKGDVL